MMTPLTMAAWGGHHNVCEVHEHEANVDQVAIDGDTALQNYKDSMERLQHILHNISS